MIVSGKLRAQRAKSMKFKDGYMISSGQPTKEYIDSAVRHVLLRQVCLILTGLILVPDLSSQGALIVFYPDQLLFFLVSGSSWNQGQDYA